jgi:raffinose/stachyose/melibiose transport system substrate-binding protein
MNRFIFRAVCNKGGLKNITIWRKDMKKIILIILGVVMIGLPLFAGGGQQKSGGSGDIVLEYWTWFPNQAQIQETIAAFEKANPGIKIKMTVMESKDFQSKTPLALSTGENIDIVGVQPSAFAGQIQEYLADLEPLLGAAAPNWKSIYSPKALQQGNSLTGGKTKILTLFTSGSMIGYYNAALLRDIGAEAPKTLAEYKAVAAKFKAKYPNKYAAVYAGKEAWVTDEMMLTVMGQKGDYYNKWRYNGAPLNGPEFRTAINNFKKFFDEGIFTKDIMDLDYGAAQEAFTRGDALTYYMGSWDAPLLSAALRKGNGINLEDVGAMALPVVEPGDTPAVRGYLDCCVGIVNSSKHKEAAAKFVAFIALQEGANLLGKQLIGPSPKTDISVDPSLFSSAAGKSGWQTIVDLITNATADRNNVSSYSDIEGAAVQSVLNGTLTTDQALQNLQREWTSGKY